MVDIDSTCGRELDVLVAERIMDCKIDASRKAADGTPMMLLEVPRYSDNAAMARGIEFRLEQRHPGAVMRYESRSPYKVVLRGPSGREYAATGESEGTAICRAMLKTMEGEGPGLPREQVEPDRSPRALNAIADLLAARAQPHQPVVILAQAVALQKGEQKEGPARVLLQYAASAKEIVPVVAEQLTNPDPDVAALCRATLECLALAGEAARQALARPKI